jgi:hypothetical protein
MSEMTHEDRHARLVAEIKLRLLIVVCSLDSLPSHSLAARAKEEHKRELSALLEIVERHRPMQHGPCRRCRNPWPCADWMSAEKILGSIPTVE